MSRIISDQGACVITPFLIQQTRADSRQGVTPFEMPSVPNRGRIADPSQSETSLEELQTAAHKQGFNEGLARGRKEGQEAAALDHKTQLVSLRASVQQVVEYRSQIRKEVEREVVDLAFAVARRILRREATLDRSAAAGIVRSCLDERSAAEVIRILVHPDDLDQVKLCVGADIDVSVSSEVARGGALLETAQGQLDARIDSQIDELQTGLADA